MQFFVSVCPIHDKPIPAEKKQNTYIYTDSSIFVHNKHIMNACNRGLIGQTKELTTNSDFGRFLN
jgi:hypothetical protein